MAGGVNSFGTLLGPLVVSWLLFGTVKEGEIAPANISNIQTLYFFLAGLFILASLVFAVAKLPKTTSNETLEKSPKAMVALAICGILFLPVLFADLIKERRRYCQIHYHHHFPGADPAGFVREHVHGCKE